MRVHVVALPHLDAIRANDYCAYTAKIRKFGAMLAARGHQMILYSGPENEAVCAEHVPVVTPELREKWFGDEAPNGRWSGNVVFNHWDHSHDCWQNMNYLTIKEMKKRIQPGDLIGLIAGHAQQQFVNAFPDNLKIEWGVGYYGILPDTFRAFESYAHMHYCYGMWKENDGRNFDTVIPNAFDPNELDYSEEKDDYLLFLGRHIPRKGTAVVEELAKHYRVITAGQGNYITRNGETITTPKPEIPGTEYRGVVLGDEKAKLIAHARAVLVPTSYIEPFGGVAVEAMMSGTPVITTDYGAFTETVQQGKTGFRCRTLREFLFAVEKVGSLNTHYIRKYAIDNYSTNTIASKYDHWLQQLSTLSGKGWYA